MRLMKTLDTEEELICYPKNEQKLIFIVIALVSFLLGGLVISGLIYYAAVSILHESGGIFSGVQLNTTIQFNETKIAELINESINRQRMIQSMGK